MNDDPNLNQIILYIVKTIMINNSLVEIELMKFDQRI